MVLQVFAFAYFDVMYDVIMFCDVFFCQSGRSIENGDVNIVEEQNKTEQKENRDVPVLFLPIDSLYFDSHNPQV